MLVWWGFICFIHRVSTCKYLKQRAQSHVETTNSKLMASFWLLNYTDIEAMPIFIQSLLFASHLNSSASKRHDALQHDFKQTLMVAGSIYWLP